MFCCLNFCEVVILKRLSSSSPRFHVRRFDWSLMIRIPEDCNNCLHLIVNNTPARAEQCEEGSSFICVRLTHKPFPCLNMHVSTAEPEEDEMAGIKNESPAPNFLGDIERAELCGGRSCSQGGKKRFFKNNFKYSHTLHESGYLRSKFYGFGYLWSGNMSKWSTRRSG